MHRVGAVTLNYRTPDLTADAVRSLLRSSEVDLFVVLVENGSGDDSWPKLQAAFGSEPRVLLVRSETNTGFAGGNNLGIKRALEAGATEGFLVNSDAVVDPQCAAKLCAAMDAWGAAAAQPMMINPDTEKVDTLGQMIAASGGVIDIGHGGAIPDVGGAPAYEIFGACAGAAMYRREVFEKVGMLPDDFFMYFEDVDLSFRLRLAGLKTVLVPSAKVFHARGGSAEGWGLKHYYAERNALAVRLRHYTARDVLAPHMFEHLARAVFQALKVHRTAEFARFLIRWLLGPRAAPAATRRHLIDGWRGVERRPLQGSSGPAPNSPA